VKLPVAIEDMAVVPATVIEEVELNSAIPTSKAPVTIKSLVNLPDPDTSSLAFGVEVPIPTLPLPLTTNTLGLVSEANANSLVVEDPVTNKTADPEVTVVPLIDSPVPGLGFIVV